MTTEPNASQPEAPRQPGDGLPPNGLDGWADFEFPADGISLLDILDAPITHTALQQQRDKAMTQLLALQIERGSLKTKVEELEESNVSLRDTLDAVRRELAEARVKLAQQPAPQPDAVALLAERVDDLEDIVYPAWERDAVLVSQPTRKEVMTLVQGLGQEYKRICDQALADALNAGWEILNLTATTHVDTSGDWPEAVHTRIVTLTREVPADHAGDDDHAGAQPEAEADAPEPEPAAPRQTILIEPPAPVVAPSLNEILASPYVSDVRLKGAEAVIADANQRLLNIAQAAYESRVHVVRRPPMPAFLLPERN